MEKSIYEKHAEENQTKVLAEAQTLKNSMEYLQNFEGTLNILILLKI